LGVEAFRGLTGPGGRLHYAPLSAGWADEAGRKELGVDGVFGTLLYFKVSGGPPMPDGISNNQYR
jgi:hypothetical protein